MWGEIPQGIPTFLPMEGIHQTKPKGFAFWSNLELLVISKGQSKTKGISIKTWMNISSYLRYLNYHFYYACAEIFLQVSRSWHLTFSTLEAGTGKTLRHDMTVNRILPTFETCLKFSRSCSRISSLYLSLDLCTMNQSQWSYFKKKKKYFNKLEKIFKIFFCLWIIICKLKHNH